MPRLDHSHQGRATAARRNWAGLPDSLAAARRNGTGMATVQGLDTVHPQQACAEADGRDLMRFVATINEEG